MHRFVALGCSLTAQEGFVDYLNSKHNINIVNLAFGSGSNGLQMFRLNNLLYQNLVGSETTLIWQITGPDRGFQLLENIHVEKIKDTIFTPSSHTGLSTYIEEVIVPFNDTIAINPLSNSLYWKDREVNYKYNLQSLMCDIYKWSKIVKNIIVILGWSWIIDSKEELNNTLALLKNCPNITIIDPKNSILDWCEKNRLPFEDDLHPTRESYENWATHNLEPLIKRELNLS